MYIVLILFHVLICLGLIATILLQAGKGGGLAEAFGGGDTAQSLLGTQAPEVLKKATEVAAILFLVTSLVLGMITARRGRSLFESGRMPVMPLAQQQTGTPLAAPQELPQPKAPEAPVQAEAPASQATETK